MGPSFSFCRTVNNAVVPTGTVCPKFHALFWFPPLNAYFHRPHVDWAVPSLVTMFHLQHTFIEAIPTWSHGYLAARISRISRATWSFSTSPSSTHTDYITYYHWDPHCRRTWTYQATSGYYQRVFFCKKTEQTKDGKSFSLHYQLRM